MMIWWWPFEDGGDDGWWRIMIDESRSKILKSLHHEVRICARKRRKLPVFTSEKLMKSWGRSAFHFRYGFKSFLEPVSDYNFSFTWNWFYSQKSGTRNQSETGFRLISDYNIQIHKKLVLRLEKLVLKIEKLVI